MSHPDKGASYSCAASGKVQKVPKKPISVVVTDKNNEPAGILEKWGSEAWFYAENDSLQFLEPELAD